MKRDWNFFILKKKKKEFSKLCFIGVDFLVAIQCKPLDTFWTEQLCLPSVQLRVRTVSKELANVKENKKFF